MKNYPIEKLTHILKTDSVPVVLYGAGILGELVFHAL